MTHPATFEGSSLPEEAFVPLEMAHPARGRTTANEDPWTAGSLFSALLELLIALLFLSGATISYLTSKFIRLFGLRPPCFDRGASRPEARYNLCDQPKEFQWFLQEKHTKKCGACEPCSPSTSCLDFDSLSSQELTRRTPQPVRKRCICVRRPYLKKRETRNYDQVVAAAKGDRCYETCPSSSDGQISGYNGTIRKQLHQRSTKRKLDSSVLENFPDRYRVVNDDRVVSAEAEGVHQLESEHSLKVFPERCVWNQENKGKGFVESSQDLSGRDSIHHHPGDTDSTRALETSFQQYSDKLEKNRHKFVDSLGDGFQLTGEYLDLPTEPLVSNVQFEGAREPIQSADFCETKGQSALIAEEPGNVFDNGVNDSIKRMPLVENGNLIDHSTIPGQLERLISSWSGIDDDSIELTEKLNRIYLELESERTASASAADEAMAMITRLQEDKAALQLQAVQYQRMAEEKAMYDEEATAVLRDILFEREVEKLCLEKEIDLYRRKVFLNRSKSVNQRELRDETGDAPLLDPEKSKENGGIDAASDCELLKRANSSAALSGLKTRFLSADSRFLSTDSESLLKSLNSFSENDISSRDSLSRQDSSGDRSSVTWKDANDADQSNDFRAAALHDRSYSPMRVNGHEITLGRKSGGTAEREGHHIWERIWNLEKQVHQLKTMYSLKVGLPPGTLSGRGMKQKLLIGRRKTSELANSQYCDSSAKQSVYHRDLGINDHVQRLIKAKSEGGAFLSSSLEPESFLPDDDANEDSRFFSTGVALSDLRESKSNLKDEVQMLVSRLQELEADREMMRQIIESMQKETEAMEVIEPGDQQLKLPQDEREGSAVCDRGPGTSLQLHDDSSLEAEKSPHMDQCFNQTFESNQPVSSSGNVIEFE